ncbi:MAG: ABC transporter permease subunit [Planctomycetota bacterium]
MSGQASTRQAEIDRLRARRPRNRFVRFSAVALLALAVYAWGWGDLEIDHLFRARTATNLNRFLTEVRPYPLQGVEWDWGVALGWVRYTLAGKGGSAVAATLAMSIAAICLAGIGAALLCLFAARNVAEPEPFLPDTATPSNLRRRAWAAVVFCTRLFFAFVRAIPEYIWAFLLLTALGPGAWPAVLALALHNLGVLGKLDSEVIENIKPDNARALRALGASRVQIAAGALYPAALGRFLLYFFYRWETCVREATVLGMLGFMGLGWFIRDTRARTFYDEMLLYVLLGSAIILAGDLLSALARRLVRTAR